MSNRRKREPVLDEDDVSGPGWGEDDVPAGEEITVTRGPGGGAYFAPRALRDLTGPKAEVVEQLQKAALDLVDAHERLDALVPAGRDVGLSWDSIGWCIGVTGAAVRQRFTE